MVSPEFLRRWGQLRWESVLHYMVSMRAPPLFLSLPAHPLYSQMSSTQHVLSRMATSQQVARIASTSLTLLELHASSEAVQGKP